MLKSPFTRAGLVGLSLLCQPAFAGEISVEPVSVPVMKSVFGQVQSRDLVPARARIGGTVTGITITEGDQVKAGQVIATVLDQKLTLQLDALDARLLGVRAQLDNAKTNLERAQQLFSRGTIAKSRLDELQTQLDVLTNQRGALDAERAVIVQQAQEGAVIAPSDGRILTIPVTQGSVILPGEPVARIAGGGYFLRLSLPERHAAGIREGDTVSVNTRTLGADGEAKQTNGTLAKVYPEIANGRVLADVEVEGLGDFFVGERVLVSIPIGTRQTLRVPAAALTTRHGIDYVTVATQAGPVEVTVIPGETFAASGGAQTEILTGLAAGDKVITP